MATLSIAAILAESAQRYPDRVAVVLGPQKVTYEELWREVRLYATVLRDRGIGPGDRVALLIPNVPDFPRFYYAVLSLGAVVVPVHALLRPEEIEYVLRDSGASLLCAAGPLVEAGAKGAEMAGVPLLTSMLPEALPGIERIEDLAAARGAHQFLRPARSGHRRGDPLHQRDDRSAEGCGAVAPQPDDERPPVGDRRHQHAAG